MSDTAAAATAAPVKPVMVPRGDGSFTFPRRSCLDQLTPAELAIRDAVQAVEKAGAHPFLTDAVNLLHQAQGKVADFVEIEQA
jgi:hypothetical protein